MWTFESTIRWMAMALLLTPMYGSDCCKNSVAIMASLSGNATARLPGSLEKAAVSAFDWLTDGVTLEVGPRSQAVVILLNGHRYELGEGAKVTLTANAAPKITGAARELPPLPPIPKPAAVVAESAPTPGAPRIRGDTEMMSELYPRAGTVALHDKVALRFKAVPKATSYRVIVESDGGDSVLNVTTGSTEVSVPSGTLEAGTHYQWRVRARSAGVALAVGKEEFSTLSAENALERTELAEALGANSHDPAALALLADIDLRLGLIAEACDEFSAALKQKPNDVTLQRALDSARASLSGKAK
jgi:hypothetical protein